MTNSRTEYYICNNTNTIWMCRYVKFKSNKNRETQHWYVYSEINRNWIYINNLNRKYDVYYKLYCASRNFIVRVSKAEAFLRLV